MSVYKDKNGTWYVMTRCDDWQGQRKQKCKRGFKTKREAQDWERRFLLQQGGDLDMLFKDFYKLYEQDMKARLKQNTWEHKACVIKSKILPYFGEKSMKDIQARDVLTWQNELLRHRDKNGKPYSETYLKNLHNQLSCIFNHAVRYYDLSTNPAAKAGSIGVKNAKEMNFWTKDEYMQFSEVMMDKAYLEPVTHFLVNHRIGIAVLVTHQSGAEFGNIAVVMLKHFTEGVCIALRSRSNDFKRKHFCVLLILSFRHLSFSSINLFSFSSASSR